MKERLYARTGRVVVATTMTAVLGPNPSRRRIVFSAPAGAAVSLQLDQSADANNGITLVPGGPYFEINFDDHGEAVTMPWFAMAAASTPLGYLEVFTDGAAPGGKATKSASRGDK